jgi:hypothetical protein
VISPVPSLIEITFARWLALMYSSACVISGGATFARRVVGDHGVGRRRRDDDLGVRRDQ